MIVVGLDPTEVEVDECETGMQFPPPPPKGIYMGYADPEKQKAYQLRYVRERREHYLKVMGNICCKCGTTENLEVDHVEPNKKIDHRIWSWSHKRIQDELTKCQLLCRDCHIAKSVEEQDYIPREHGTNLMYLKDKCRCDDCKAAHAVVNRKYR